MSLMMCGEQGRHDACLKHPSIVDVLNHEIRTPLAILVGHAELLQDLDLSGSARHSVSVISAAAERLARVTDALSRLADAQGNDAELLRLTGFAPALPHYDR